MYCCCIKPPKKIISAKEKLYDLPLGTKIRANNKTYVIVYDYSNDQVRLLCCKNYDLCNIKSLFLISKNWKEQFKVLKIA